MKKRTNLLRPPETDELRINLRLSGKQAHAVKDAMTEFGVDAPTAVRILIAEAANGKRVA